METETEESADAPPTRQPMRTEPSRLVRWLGEDPINPARWVETLPPPDFTGSLTAWSEDGTRYSVSHFWNGLKHGEETLFYPDGALFRRWAFDQGDAEGPCTEWYPSGVRALHAIFRDGFHEGEASFYEEDGLPYAVGAMRRGKKHGLWSNYLPGKSYPFAQESYVDGVLSSQRVLEEPTPAELRRVQERAARKKTHSHKALWDRYLTAARSAPAGIQGRLARTAAWRELDAGDFQACFDELDRDRDGALDAGELRAGGIADPDAPSTSADARWSIVELTQWCRTRLGG